MSNAPLMASGTGRGRPDPAQARLLGLASYASVTVAVALVGLKIWGWLATDSVALLSSLADSLLDVIASGITLYAIRVAVSPADAEHRFGHGKSEGIAGLLQAFIVTVSALYVGAEAIGRLLSPTPISQPGVGLTVMGASLCLTVALVVFQHLVVQRTGSLAISADALHYRADVLTNLAILGALFFGQRFGWQILDPLLALIVAGLILLGVRRIVLAAIDVLLDRELPSDQREKIERIAFGHSAVRGVHDLRTRSSGFVEFIQFHLELDPHITLIEAHRISDEVEGEVRAAFPNADVIIHADPHGFLEPRDPF